MKRQEISRFASANPTSNKAQPPHDLFDEIVADPRPESTTAPVRSHRQRNRILQVCAAILAAFVIGGGVSWAANGEFAGGLLFGHELDEGLRVSSEDATADDFSVLQPAGPNVVPELPDQALLALQSFRVIPPTPEQPMEAPQVFNLRPGTITAVGEAHTNPSGDVSIVAINGAVCSIWVEIHLSNCDTPDVIDKEGLISAGHFGPGGDRMALGLVNDRVSAIRIEGTNLPDVPVSGNVFEVTGLPEGSIALVGVDSEGNEVIRRAMP
jgi:hypothetical protein